MTPSDHSTTSAPIGARSLIDVLVAEDEPVSRRLLEKSLLQWGYRPVVCPDGLEALVLLRSPNAPRIAVLDIVQGLRAGADDYITKPVDREEFEARLQVASRIVGLQQRLSDRVTELEVALTRVRQLQGLLPICAYCKRIRDDQNYWNQVETYLAEHTDVQFSHGICPSCFERVIQDERPGAPPKE